MDDTGKGATVRGVGDFGHADRLEKIVRAEKLIDLRLNTRATGVEMKSTNTIETRNKLLLKVILTPVFQDMDTEVAELHQLMLDTSAVLSYVFEKSPDYRTAEGLTLWANINLEIECIAAAKIKAR